MTTTNAQEFFAEKCREITGYTDPEDYYYKETDSAIDHMEVESQSSFAWKFFLAGMEAQKRIK